MWCLYYFVGFWRSLGTFFFFFFFLEFLRRRNFFASVLSFSSVCGFFGQGVKGHSVVAGVFPRFGQNLLQNWENVRICISCKSSFHSGCLSALRPCCVYSLCIHFRVGFFFRLSWWRKDLRTFNVCSSRLNAVCVLMLEISLGCCQKFRSLFYKLWRAMGCGWLIRALRKLIGKRLKIASICFTLILASGTWYLPFTNEWVLDSTETCWPPGSVVHRTFLLFPRAQTKSTENKILSNSLSFIYFIFVG